MMHQPADLFPPAKVPNFDNLFGAAGGEPFAAARRGSDGFDAGDMGREDELRLEVEVKAGVVT